MSTTVPVSFKRWYSDEYHERVAQEDSRLSGAVRVETGVTGESFSFDRLGSSDMQEITTRHGDVNYGDLEHDRRGAFPTDYEWVELVDKKDTYKLKVDPESAYVRRGMQAANRRKDQTIIDAGLGNAYSTKNLGTAVALPAGQKVAVDFDATAATNLTIPKIREAKRLMDAAEVPEEGRYLAITASQVSSLLAITEYQSGDYNAIKPLENGELVRWLGFNMVRLELLPVATNVRRVMAWHEDGIGMAMFEPGTYARVDEIPTKRYSTQIGHWLSVGAVRIEDECVVEISCNETVFGNSTV